MPVNDIFAPPQRPGCRAAIYVRVSTDEQTYENQIPVLEGWAAQRGFEVIEVYAENASAWHEGKQREFARLLLDARARRFDCVIVWALDRISREGPLRILDVVHKLRGWGCPIYSKQDPWTEAPGELGDLLYSVSGWAARFYSNRISVNTRAGIERKRKTGWKPGRPKGSKDTKKRKARVTKL